MSRTFQIWTNRNQAITLSGLLDCIKGLTSFANTGIDLKTMRIFTHNPHTTEITPDKSEILVNDETNYITLCIRETDASSVHISFHDHRSHHIGYDYCWSVESRALDGKSRSLFLAVVSTLAILTDEQANSCDGAWHDGNNYTGEALWKEYLTQELSVS